MVRAARSIETLSLAHCVRVTDAALKDAILYSGGSFTNLDFSGTGVGDALVNTALRKCGQLRVLRLALCLNVTTAILPTLVSDGRNLRLLDLTGAGGHPGSGKQMLRGSALRDFTLLPQMQGCTVLADYHEKGAPKRPAAIRRHGVTAAQSGSGSRRRAYTAATAASMASSTESSWLPVVHARYLQGNLTAEDDSPDAEDSLGAL